MGRAERKWQLRRCILTDGGAAIPQPNDLSRSLVALDQNSTIIAVVELSQSSWLVGGVVPGIESLVTPLALDCESASNRDPVGFPVTPLMRSSELPYGRVPIGADWDPTSEANR